MCTWNGKLRGVQASLGQHGGLMFNKGTGARNSGRQ